MSFFFFSDITGAFCGEKQGRQQKGAKATPRSPCCHLNTAERQEWFIASVFYLYVVEVKHPVIAKSKGQIEKIAKAFHVAGRAVAGTTNLQQGRSLTASAFSLGWLACFVVFQTPPDKKSIYISQTCFHVFSDTQADFSVLAWLNTDGATRWCSG